jgi:16S rRNA (adenine1518-N6/adenine1519-N6)-dimethyltransferase
MARQRLGQHFLTDTGWREKIARAIGVSPHSGDARQALENSCWIEIGAGHGEMTEHLAASGAPVYAIEIDPPLIAHLERLREKLPNLTVVAGDVLETNLHHIAGERRISLYGNLPYYITSPILHHVFRYAPQIDAMHFVTQLEVAERVCAQPGTKLYGYLSVATQFYARPEIALRLPRGAFRPPPEVASALVTLRLPGEGAPLGLGQEEAARFLQFIKQCFGQKRKTLVNNLRPMAPPDRVREALAAMGLRPDARAEQLAVAQLIGLHRCFLGNGRS